MHEKLLGRYVVVRSNMSGVWFGKLVASRGEAGGDFAVELENAAKIHYWVGAAATSGLALLGPKQGSRVCHDLEVAVVAGCCEILLCAPPAIDAMASIERWDAQ